MNKITLALSSVAIILSSIAIFNSGDDELAYVDVNKLLNNYSGAEKVQREFQEKSKALKANVDSMISDWHRQTSKFEEERSSMSEKEIELQSKLLIEKKERLEDYQNAVKKQLIEEDKKTSRAVISELNKFIVKYGEEHDYELIFGANGSGSLLFGEESTDITEELIQALNED